MRIFVEPAELRSGEIAIAGDEHHYIAVARRSRPGDTLELVDGTGRQASATILKIAATATTVAVGPVGMSRDALPAIRVLVPLIKGERMDLCLEKLVEVGATEVVVWPAARSVVRLDAKRRADRQLHYARTIQAAARQCRRATVPAISVVDSLNAAIARLPPDGRVMLDPTAPRTAMPTSLSNIAVASGPEGGLSPNETDALTAAGFAPVGLGPRVLRAETAPVVAVALIRAMTDS